MEIEIDPIIFENENEFDDYIYRKVADIELASTLEGGLILATLAFNVSEFITDALNFGDYKESEVEIYKKVYDSVAQVHAAALSSYLASGGKLKKL